MTVETLQANMTRGELSPYLHARVDTEHYQSGLERARNVVVVRYGGVTRTPGTLFGAAAKNANKAARFIPFRFNVSQVYAIEAGDLYFRFWVMGASGPERIEVAGTPVEVVTPYLEADLRYLQVRQSADVIYIWCRGYQLRTLTRNSETSWALATYTPQNGPYLKENDTATTLTPADTGHITPKMTSNTAPAGYTVSNADAAAFAYEFFDRNKTGNVLIDNVAVGYVQVQLPTARVADAYWMTGPTNAGQNEDYITVWELQGSNDGSSWVTLDSRTGETGWANSETRFFEFSNKVAYLYYRLSFSGGGGADANDSVMAELAIHWAASDQTPFNLVASSTTGINDGAGFKTTDVGRAIRLWGSDGKWRWAEIASRVDATTVTIRLHGHALPDTRPITRWALGAWSDETGWPVAGGLYEDRLVGVGTTEDPIGGAASVSQDYDNFSVSDPIVDDDAVAFRMTGGELNEARWVVESRDMVVGTAGSLRIVGRNDSNKAFGPSNVRQKPETFVGASYATPVVVENIILFLDTYETRLYEAAFTYEVEGYVARELSALSEHLFAVGVVEIGYQSHPHRILWGRRSDGKMVACTYDRDQKVFGVTLVDFGGVVEGFTLLPGNKQTDLFMIMQRTVDGSTVRYVEALAPFYRADLSTLPPVYAASAVIYDGVAIDTVTGLDHLEGATVAVYGDGVDHGDFQVSGGEVGPLPAECSQIVVGLRMPWEVKTLRLERVGNQDGNGLGRKVDIVSAKVDLYESAGVYVVANGHSDPLKYEEDFELSPFDPPPLRSGIKELAADDSWTGNGQIAFAGDKMYPVTIRAIALQIDGEP